MKKITLLLLVFSFYFLVSSPLSAQTDYEVVITRKTAQLPSYPAAYISNPLQYFAVTVTNNTGAPSEVYLTVAVYYNDSRIVYSENRPSPMPLLLSPGLNVIPNPTLEDHFSGRMLLDMDALNQALPGNSNNPLDQLSSITRLPEGNYRMALYVHPWADETSPTDPYTEGSIDEEFEIIYSATPPEIITPLSEQVNWGAAQREDSRDRTRSQQKTTKREDDFSLLTSMGRGSSTRNALTPQRKLTFRWTPVITTSAYPYNVEYTLKIVAVLPQQNAQDAIDHNPVVVTTTTKNTYVIIDTLQDLKYQFEAGSTYAMQVQAVSTTPPSGGIARFFEEIEISNEGKSQLVTFSWGRAKYGIQYNELKAPLDTAILEIHYHDNIPHFLRYTKLPSLSIPETVDPATFSLDSLPIHWTAVTGPNIVDINYTPHIYPYLGQDECTLCQKPITDKSQMKPGDLYYLDLETQITYLYHWDSVYATVYYVNGIEADTEADTVVGDAKGPVVRHVGNIFRYGYPTKAKSKTASDFQFPTPNVGLRLTTDYDPENLCVYLNWYHSYKSKNEGQSKNPRDAKKKSKGLFHTVVYRSINDGPYVGIATLNSDTETYIDRDFQPGQNVSYFVRLHISPTSISAPSNITRLHIFR